MDRMPRIRALTLSATAMSALALLTPTVGEGSHRLPAPQPHVTATAARAHLQVVEVEYRLALSSGVIKAGPVNLETIDRGLDPHDLRLQEQGSSSQLSAPELTSGQHWNGVVDLKPGVYKLWCSLPEHARLGMHTLLRVVR
jgi:hypothetical protein